MPSPAGDRSNRHHQNTKHALVSVDWHSSIDDALGVLVPGGGVKVGSSQENQNLACKAMTCVG
jgi:hypothetical protein